MQPSIPVQVCPQAEMQTPIKAMSQPQIPPNITSQPTMQQQMQAQIQAPAQQQNLPTNQTLMHPFSQPANHLSNLFINQPSCCPQPMFKQEPAHDRQPENMPTNQPTSMPNHRPTDH